MEILAKDLQDGDIVEVGNNVCMQVQSHSTNLFKVKDENGEEKTISIISNQDKVVVRPSLPPLSF